MSKCVKLRRKKTQVCIGDLDTLIDIRTRSVDKSFGSKEGMTFTTVFSPWAMVETPKDLFIIDDVATGREEQVTHRFTIRFPDQTVSAANWVRVGTTLYRILGQLNFENRGEFLQIPCTERGAQDKEASNA